MRLSASLFALAALCVAQQQVSGRYQVTLRLPPEGLFAREETQIEFHVEDTYRPDPLGGYTAVVRAAPEAVIDMPEMPGMPKFAEIAHMEGVPGDYGIHPTFAHGGDYRLRLSIRPPAGEVFQVVFPLKVVDGIKRKPAPSRYALEFSAEPKRPKAGETVELRMSVRDRDRDNGVVTGFETVHEAKMHLVVVRKDLSQFAHAHPELQPDGTFRLTYMFAAGGDYRLFADVAPRGAGAQVLSAKLNVRGPEGARFDVRSASGVTKQNIAGTIVELTSSAALPAGRSSTVVFSVRDSRTGEPARDLEPYLGAAGHLMLVHEDAATFVHSHPTGDNDLCFLARLPKPGLYRGWLQFQRSGQLLTAEIILRAEEKHE